MEAEKPAQGGNGPGGMGRPAQGSRGDTQEPARISRKRLILVNSLIGVTTLLLVVGIFSVWANRLLFNPNNWANTSTQLLQNEKIRTSTANYLVDQLYTNYDVTGELKSGLPARLQPLAAPAAGALRTAAEQAVETALSRPRVQDLWARANRAADQTFVDIVKGGKGNVAVNQGAVTLNLGNLLNELAARLGVSANVGGKLPANAANLTVFKSKQLKLVQNVGNAIRGLALVLTILCPLLYALAIFLARGHRRRTLMTVGFAAIVAGVLVLLGRSLLQSQVPSSLTHDASAQATITAVVSIATGMIVEICGACIFVGILLIAAGWFAGPASVARSGRRSLAPFLRERPVETYAIALALVVLLFIWNPIPATGKPAGMIVFTLLALLGTHVLRLQTAEEFPEARAGAATAAVRAHVASLGQGRQASAQREPGSVPEQLRQLAELRDRGDISAAEYRAAKEQLLHTSP